MKTYNKQIALCLLFALYFSGIGQNNWDAENNGVELSTRLNTIIGSIFDTHKKQPSLQDINSYFSLSVVNRTLKTVNYRFMASFNKNKFQYYDYDYFNNPNDTSISYSQRNKTIEFEIRPGFELSKMKKKRMSYVGFDASLKSRTMNEHYFSTIYSNNHYDLLEYNSLKTTSFIFGIIGFYGWKWMINDKVGLKYNIEYGVYYNYNDNGINTGGGHFLSLTYKI